MAKDYSAFGPAYRNFKVREEVYVPEPPEEFSGDDPFVKMAPIRGELKDIKFDETYPYLDTRGWWPSRQTGSASESR